MYYENDFLVHNYTIFLCSLDIENIDDIDDDQYRGPSKREEDHLRAN